MAGKADNIALANGARTAEESRENGRRGGVASGLARRYRSELEKAAGYAIRDARAADAIRDMIGARTPRNYHRAIVALMTLVNRGDLAAIKYYNELLGLRPEDGAADARPQEPIRIEVVDAASGGEGGGDA